MAASRQLAAIMFADVVGFTEFAQIDEKGAVRLLEELEGIVMPVLEQHHGRKVKSMGDGLLAEFPDALDAVECAVALQRAVHERNVSEDRRPLRLRVGLHLGDVERRGADIVGDAVNVASRVEPLAEPGGVSLSEHVVLHVRNKVPYHFESLGLKSLKGVRDPIAIYRVTLPWISPEPVPVGVGAPRLAVLPLANISPDTRDEYFADGLTEELISVLSRLHGLRVIARTSIGQYKSTSKTIRQVGSELGVGAVLEGSVRRAGDRLRITLQLIDAQTEEHRWAETYDRELKDVFAIQTDIAERTAGALRLQLQGPDRSAIRKTPTQSWEAYESYLHGISAFQRTADTGWTRQGLDEASRFFETAISKDPSFSMAYAYLANLLIAGMGESVSKASVADRVRELVATALRLGPDESDVHTARGNYALQFELDWPRAEEEFRRAIQLSPSNTAAHGWYAILLGVLGRFEEANSELEVAARLDPLFRSITYWQIRIRERMGDRGGAIAISRGGLDREPENRYLRILLAGLLLREGRVEEARREAVLAAGPVADVATAVGRAEVLGGLGDLSEARELQRRWEQNARGEYVRATYLARVLLVLGEKEKALQVLEQDCTRGERALWIDFRGPSFDAIRNDPRFIGLLRAWNLAT